MFTKLEAYLALGAGVLILLGCFYGLYRYEKYRADGLEAQNRALALGQQVILKAQAKSKETREKVQVITRKVQDENAMVQQEEMAGNDSALDARLERFYGVRGTKGGVAPGGPGGSSGHATP